VLVLSRGVNESIVIGDQIRVTVVAIKGDKVRLGVSAPKEWSVHRQEIYEEIQKANLQASQVRKEDIQKLGSLFPDKTRKP
jgi:carbon storage regulator